MIVFKIYRQKFHFPQRTLPDNTLYRLFAKDIRSLPIVSLTALKNSSSLKNAILSIKNIRIIINMPK